MALSRRSFVAGSVAAAAALSVAGPVCAIADEPKTLTVSLASSPSKLDPVHYTGTYEGQIIGQVCSRLIEYNDALNEFVPSLATSWEVSEDGITYVFQIRQGVKLHESEFNGGRELTAEDVAYSLNRSKALSDNGRLVMLDHADVTGDWEVTCTLETANAAFLTALTDAGNSIYCQEDVDGYGDNFGVNLKGTGAFKLVEFNLDENAVLEANPDYFVAAPNVDKLVFRFITDYTQAANAVLTGEVDIATDLAGEAINTVRNSDAVELVELQALQINYVRFNMTHPAMSDIRVRKAMIEAVNLDEVRAALYQYDQAVAAYCPLPFGSWAYDPQYESIVPEYNLEDAINLMNEAGWGQGFEADIYVSNTEERKTLATLLQAYWATIGITLNINVCEWGTFSDMAASGKADVYAMSWSWYPDPYFFLNNLFASWNTASNGNGAQYINQEVDDLLMAAVQTTVQEERAALYQQVIEITMNDFAGIYYATPNKEYGINPRVKDFVVRADGTLRFVTPERNTSVE